jgi:hypothetical protein
VLVDRLRRTVAAATARPGDAIAVGHADVREVLSALDAAEAECARLRGELAAVRRAVRMLDGARAAIDANGQRTLRSLAGVERAGLLEELAAARRERDDWNARATAMEAERDRQLTAVAAERTRREAAEASATRSADAAVDAVRELGHVAAAAVARADAAEARLAALAAAVREERAVTAEHEHAWAAHITADDLAGAEEVLALDARLDAAITALDAALGAT